MKVLLVLAAVIAALSVAVPAGSLATGAQTTRAPSQPWWFEVPQIEFGFIKSLTPLGNGYKLRLDLHLRFGPDGTGIHACIDSGDCSPSTNGFPDDTYDRDLKYVVTYFVPPGAPVTLVGRTLDSPVVTTRYLYGLAHGRNPKHLEFLLPTSGRMLTIFGFYIEVGSTHMRGGAYEAVTRMGQVYHP